MLSAEAGIMALGDRNRLLLLRLLLERSFSVGDLTHISGLGQSLVSHHLAVLVRTGWLVSQRDGRRRLYRPGVDGSPLASLAHWIKRCVVLPDDWRSRGAPFRSLPAARREKSDLEDYLL
jgi:DNA-binding transcriptional ArsR family regulator